MGDRAAFGWAVRTGRGGDGRAGSPSVPAVARSAPAGWRPRSSRSPEGERPGGPGRRRPTGAPPAPICGSGLKGLDDFPALEAAGADVGTARNPVDQHPDPLEVRIEATVRGDHRVGAVVPETGLLPTDIADLGHGRSV